MKPVSLRTLRVKPLYIDRSLVIVNKPAGIVSQLSNDIQTVRHASSSTHLSEANICAIGQGFNINKTAGTLVAECVPQFVTRTVLIPSPVLQNELELGEKPWPVHRLDKVLSLFTHHPSDINTEQATTGALLLARSPTNLHALHTQFKTHQVEKTYLALVRGGEKSFPGKSGVLKDVFRYSANGRFDRIMPIGAEKEAADWEDGKRKIAETHWEVLATSPKAPISLVKLNLVTGMKHQLRIHMAKLLQGE